MVAGIPPSCDAGVRQLLAKQKSIVSSIWCGGINVPSRHEVGRHAHLKAFISSAIEVEFEMPIRKMRHLRKMRPHLGRAVESQGVSKENSLLLWDRKFRTVYRDISHDLSSERGNTNPFLR